MAWIGVDGFWFFSPSRADSSARPASPSQDDDDRKSGSRSRGKSGRAASDSGGSHHRRGASAKELAHHIKSVIGISTRVNVTEPEGVARSQGKAVRVVDNRPKGG